MTKLHYLLAGLIFLTNACSSQYNTVRLQRKPKQGLSLYSLTTEHYLHIDENHVLELDRGERSLQIEFNREVTSAGLVSETTKVTVKLYHDDAPFSGKVRVRLNNADFDLVSDSVTRENFAEAVTVLDTGQRQEDNASLANSAQAQTGYITFGKPVAAGSSKRRWKIYRMTVPLDSALSTAMQSIKQLEIAPTIRGQTAVCDVSDRQIAAWKRFAAGNVDTEIDP